VAGIIETEVDFEKAVGRVGDREGLDLGCTFALGTEACTAQQRADPSVELTSEAFVGRAIAR